MTHYLNNTRNAIPLGAEQTALVLRIIDKALSTVDYFADLGCGDGFLSKVIKLKYPLAKGLLVDSSPHMLAAAEENLKDCAELSKVQSDFSTDEWTRHLKTPPDLVISGYAVHHLSDEKKQRFYRVVLNTLRPGGLFLNIEHVASASPLGEALFDELMVDTLYDYLKARGRPRDKQSLLEEFRNRLDKSDNILSSVGCQCDWLRGFGFADVDCFFKCFELAVFGGRKP